MAAKITHLEVLKQALVFLEHGNEKQHATAGLLGGAEFNRFACLGSVAPDIFYFYHIFSRKKNKKAQVWGNLSHHKRIREFVMYLLDLVKRLPEGELKNKKTAFAMGYISHIAVDIITHPYIFYYTGNYYSEDDFEASEAQANHLRVEYALDSYIVDHRWGMSPYEYNFYRYVDCRERLKGRKKSLDFDIWSMWSRAFAEVYPEEYAASYPGSYQAIKPGDIINESYLGFLKFNRLLDSRSRSVRGLLKSLDVLTFRKMKVRYLILPVKAKIDPRIPNEDGREWKYPARPELTSSESFMTLIHKAARISASCITEAVEYLEGNRKAKDTLKEFQDMNLDTGLQSESLEMIEFEPLKEDGG